MIATPTNAREYLARLVRSGQPVKPMTALDEAIQKIDRPARSRGATSFRITQLPSSGGGLRVMMPADFSRRFFAITANNNTMNFGPTVMGMTSNSGFFLNFQSPVFTAKEEDWGIFTWLEWTYIANVAMVGPTLLEEYYLS
jgi:hypothetical protein